MKPNNYTSAHQSITYSRRMMLVGGAQVALGAALITRLGYLSVNLSTLDRDRYMSPEEARDWGLIDAIFTERAELAMPMPELPMGR